MPSPVPLARVVRSGVEEAVHLGSIAAVDVSGRLVASVGDPGRLVFARSTTKPLQAAVSLRRIGGDGPSEREIAVMAASHNAEPAHVEAARRLLDRAGLAEESLRCPPALPRFAEEARAVPGPAPILHNCSGKHAGMLLACVRSGADPGSYPDPDHPLQREVLEAVTVATGAPPEAVGVDGCGVPVHAYPLAALATGFARLSRPESLGGDLGPLVARVVAAMRAQPYLVAGRRRLCTAVMESAPGLVVKVGAEGLVCAALLDRGTGLALKVEDGSARGRDAALVRALALLEALDPEAETIRAFAAPPVLGGGRRVGEVRSGFELARG